MKFIISIFLIFNVTIILSGQDSFNFRKHLDLMGQRYIGVSVGLGKVSLDVDARNRTSRNIQFGVNLEFERDYFSLMFFTRFNQHSFLRQQTWAVSNKALLNPIHGVVDGTKELILDYIDVGINTKFMPLKEFKIQPYVILGLHGFIKTREQRIWMFDDDRFNRNDHCIRIYGSGLGFTAGTGVEWTILKKWKFSIQYDFSRSITNIIYYLDDSYYDRPTARLVIQKRLGKVKKVR